MKRFTALLFTAGAVLFPAVSPAANINIDNSNSNGSVTIAWSQFDAGFAFTVNGQDHSGTQGSVTFTPTPDRQTLTFHGYWISNGAAEGEGAQQSVYFVDPGTTHVRDLLTITSGGPEAPGGTAFIDGSFATDVPTDLGTVSPDAPILPISGGFQSANPKLTIPQNLTVNVAGPTGPPPNTLGTTGTSSNPSGGSTTTVNQTVTQSVNTATGNTYIKFSDLVAIGKGLHFSFVRSYNNQDSYSGPLCRGWTHSYNILLTTDAVGNVTIKEADGHQDLYSAAGTPGTYVPRPGVYNTLRQGGAPNTWTLTRPDQSVLTFSLITGTAFIRLVAITEGKGNTQTLSYDTNGNLTNFVDVGSTYYTFAYDSSSHLLSVTEHAGTQTRMLQYSCEAGTNKLTQFTDPNGKVSLYSYDSSNLLSTITDPSSHPAIKNQFDSRGRITTITRTTGATSYVTTYSYDDVNNTATITDSCRNITRHYYDPVNRSNLQRIVNASGFVTSFTYDSDNNVASTTNGLGQTTKYSYDSNGNRTTLQDPLGDVTTWHYDAKNRLTSTTDAKGNPTGYTYDSSGNLLTVTDALGSVTSFTYDSHGNKLTFQNARGKNTVYTYDPANRLLTTRDPLGNTTTLTYDAFGRISTQKEPAQNVKTLMYDLDGRITSVSYTQGSTGGAPGAVTYTYDANGNRLTMTDPSGKTSYTYDALNRVTKISFPTGRSVAYGYGCNDNRTSISYPGKSITYTYDAVSRMATVSDGAQNTAYTYDGADNVRQVSYPNAATVGYNYDAAGRLTQVVNEFTGSATTTSTPISSYTYLLDKFGNRIQVTDGGGVVTSYSYDRLNRLVKSAVASKASSYAYDATGNRTSFNAPATSVDYTYDDADRLMSSGGTPFNWDANGNLVGQGTGKTGVTYQFDAADRMIKASGGSLTTSTFAYDGDGDRISQNVGSGIYSYVNDISTPFSTVLFESGPDGDISYVRGRELISATGPQFTNFYQYDAQSTVAGVTDARGHLAQRYVYDVFGARTLSVPAPQVGTQNKFGFTGEALDPGTALYYLRARYYDPSTGRFINKDPLPGFEKNPQTLNRYAYSRNNPATLTDRTGLCSWDDGFSDCDELWPGAPLFP